MSQALAQDFLQFALSCNVLRFGEFKTKAGRMSPYFFNAGLFNTGEMLDRLSHFYKEAILQSGCNFDLIFGPAYKGIPLAAATAMALSKARAEEAYPFAFNRKEVKDHGEGGDLIGAPLKGNILILDDVLSAGTSVRESIDLILAHNARPAGVVIALDRQERGTTARSAAEEIKKQYKIPVISIAHLDDLVKLLQSDPKYQHNLAAVERYRQQHGMAHRT
ncbi:orotate phosphoribosyltransferase [Magnetococcales bacterium HHB-1]